MSNGFYAFDGDGNIIDIAVRMPDDFTVEVETGTTAVIDPTKYKTTFNTTAGACAATLADGETVGQVKKVILIVDGGDVTVTPATYADGSTFTLSDVGDYRILMWVQAGWTTVDSGREVIDGTFVNEAANFVPVFLPDDFTVEAETAAEVVIDPSKYVTTFDTTSNAIAASLADGTKTGQLKKVWLIVDGGSDVTITPANFTDGSTLTMADAGDYATLMWDGTGWTVVHRGLLAYNAGPVTA